MDSRMDSILDQCLEALRGGETVEDCLARNPEEAEWLEPLLRLASGIQDLAPGEPLAAEAVASGRAVFLDQAASLQGAVAFSTLERMRTGYQRLGLWQRVAVTAATVLAMIGLIGGGAVMASPGGASGFLGQITTSFRSLFNQETPEECQNRIEAAFERRFEELELERDELALEAEAALAQLESELAAELQELEDETAEELAELEAEAEEELGAIERDEADDADEEELDQDEDEDSDGDTEDEDRDDEEDATDEEDDRNIERGEADEDDEADEAEDEADLDDDEDDIDDEADEDDEDEALERDREAQEILAELETERLEILAEAERERQELLDEFEEDQAEIDGELAEALAELDAEEQELMEELEEELQGCLDDDEEDDEDELHLQGTVESVGDGFWVISGVTFLVNEETELDEGGVVGVAARVEYVELSDGSFLALEIQFDDGDD